MKLADFGLSHMNSMFEFIPFAPGGTPAYESLEMLTGKHISSEADVWALGVIGYELCELKKPFSGSTRRAVKEDILNNDVPTIGEQYSKRLRNVISSMLEKKPDKRIRLLDLLNQVWGAAPLSPVQSESDNHHSNQTSSMEIRQWPSWMIYWYQ